MLRLVCGPAWPCVLIGPCAALSVTTFAELCLCARWWVLSCRNKPVLCLQRLVEVLPSLERHKLSPAMTDKSENSFDLRLIPEFGGSRGDSVSEWFEKLELVCRLRGVKDLTTVVPLKLTGGAFAVYQHLTDKSKEDIKIVKNALISAFSTDAYIAYEQFIARRLKPGESADVYLADLRNLATLFGGIPEKALTCAFVAELPDSVRQLLRASSRIETLVLEEVLARARAVMNEDQACVGTGAVAAGVRYEARSQQPNKRDLRTCFECGEPNHIARDCLLRRRGPQRITNSVNRRNVRCFRCNGLGHRAVECPGNEQGEKSHAPVSSPKHA